jgi:hypothetical protein
VKQGAVEATVYLADDEVSRHTFATVSLLLSIDITGSPITITLLTQYTLDHRHLARVRTSRCLPLWTSFLSSIMVAAF